MRLGNPGSIIPKPTAIPASWTWSVKTMFVAKFEHDNLDTPAALLLPQRTGAEPDIGSKPSAPMRSAECPSHKL